MAWAASAMVPSAAGRWSAYLNYLCQLTLQPWLQSLDLAVESCWPEGEAGFPLWQAVGGFRLSFGSLVLVVISSESMDPDSVSIPQEWVDLPEWAGDYYLPVQIEPEAGLLQLLGCLTYAQVKASPYQPIDRSYEATWENGSQSVEALAVAQQLGLNPTLAQRPSDRTLANLTEAQAQSLIRQTQTQPPALVRLTVPFAQWGALVSQSQWLEQLAQPAPARQPSGADPAGRPSDWGEAVTALGNWLSQGLTQGWQTLDQLAQLGYNPAPLALRRSAIDDENPVISAARLLSLAPDALDLSSGSEDPAQLLLVLKVQTVADGRRAIRVQLHPLTRSLSADLSLNLSTPEGQILQSVTARPQDRYIQLKQFKCLPNQPFDLTIATSQARLQAHFLA
jgi:hypothetical protein